MTGQAPAPDREALRRARSFLFVPADRPERFGRALDSGADAVVVDLEDSVAPAAKDAALGHVLELLTQAPDTVVRINDPRTPYGAADLAGLAGLAAPVAVMVPKAESLGMLARVRTALGPGAAVLPLIETATGILGAAAVAAVPGVVRLIFGHLDLCAELSLRPEDASALAPARFALLVASASAGLPAPVDGVCTEVRDARRVLAEARASIERGFTGKLCIHPDQVPVVHRAMAPGEEDLAWARRVLAAVDERGVGLVDGRMVDRPVYRRARSIVARATRLP